MVGHLLLDADGVLQHVAGDWVEPARPHLGERSRELLEHFWVRETPALEGRADVLDLLDASLAALGFTVRAAELYPLIWLDTEVVTATFDVVRRARAAGYAVHLGTNQTARRAEHMRTDLGYDDLFDVSVYSCDLGVAKPDPRYFERAVELIGAAPAEVVFVDDSAPNVEAARSVGLGGVHWRHTEGVAELGSRLAAAGVSLGG